MKKGIPCNEYTEYGPKHQNSITFTFVTDDGLTPSFFRISLGDPDPLTGEPISDRTIFREYHCQRNREIYYNKLAAAVPFTQREQEERRHLRDQIAADFERDYGYPLTSEAVDILLNERHPKKYRVELDSLVTKEGNPCLDALMALADPTAERAFLDAESDGERVEKLRAFAAKLTGRLRDVYDLMLQEAAGFSTHGQALDIAKKWGVTKSCISKDKLRLIRDIRRWMEE